MRAVVALLIAAFAVFSPTAVYALADQSQCPFGGPGWGHGLIIEPSVRMEPNLSGEKYPEEVVSLMKDCLINFGGEFVLVHFEIFSGHYGGAIYNVWTGEVFDIPPSTLGEYSFGSLDNQHELLVDSSDRDLATTYVWIPEDSRWAATRDGLVEMEFPSASEWKSVFYTEDGRVVRFGEGKTFFDSWAAAYNACLQVSAECLEGVTVPADWFIAFLRCTEGPHRYVSGAVSEDGQNWGFDDLLVVLSQEQEESCTPVEVF